MEIDQGHIEQALTSAQESLSLASGLAIKPLTALVLGNFANIALAQQDYVRATTLCEQRLQIAYELDDRSAVALLKLKLSNIALKQRSFSSSTLLAQASLSFFEDQQDHPTIALALCILGDIQREQENFSQALHFYKAALLIEREIGGKRDISQCLISIAHLLLRRAQPAQATWLLAFTQLERDPAKEYAYANRLDYQAVLEKTSSLLGDAAFNAAWTRGYALSFDELITLCDA